MITARDTAAAAHTCKLDPPLQREEALNGEEEGEGKGEEEEEEGVGVV